MAREDSREKVMRAALRLFNASGFSSISTNHIARAARISVGNLYYHFPDRESIIRALFVQMAESIERVWETPSDVEEFVRASADVFWEYRCFHREIFASRRNDPRLNRLWRSHLERIRRLWHIRIAAWTPGFPGDRATSRSASREVLALNVLLAVAGSGLQSFESAVKAPKTGVLSRTREGMLEVMELFGISTP